MLHKSDKLPKCLTSLLTRTANNSNTEKKYYGISETKFNFTICDINQILIQTLTLQYINQKITRKENPYSVNTRHCLLYLCKKL